MKSGKKICELLKDIRKQIADDNGIEYIPTPCANDENCLGTCPLCDQELKELEEAFDHMRHRKGTIIINKREIDNVITKQDNKQIQRIGGCPAPVPLWEESKSTERKVVHEDDLPF